MNVLTIPDSHLKAWMFDSAEKIIEQHKPDKVVVLGDLVDDWDQQRCVMLYQKMMDKCVAFATKYPDTVWLYGNHDIAYLDSACQCSGHSVFATATVAEGLSRIQNALNNEIKTVARIDDVFFSHAGLAEVECQLSKEAASREAEWDLITEHFNQMNYRKLWTDLSPIWYRPNNRFLPYSVGGCLQVAGHTPVRMAGLFQNLLITDTFSTDRALRPLGNQYFTMVDTETHELTFFDKEAGIVSNTEVVGIMR